MATRGPLLVGMAEVGGRFALVTGAASGMGAATAKLLAASGAAVAACDINPVDDVVTAITLAGGKSAGFAFDAGDPESIKALAAAVLRWSGGNLDILVNNAGVSQPTMLDADDATYEAAWAFCFAVNVAAQQRLTRAVLAALLQSSAGRVINIASTEGMGATLFNSAYVASKHASIGLTKAMAVELGSRGITVNAICPGPIRTGMTEAIAERGKALFATRLVPTRRYGHAEEVAFITLSLADARASFINGVAIPVDGGIMANNALLPMKLPWDRAAESKL